jgi:hypothetical protein
VVAPALGATIVGHVPGVVAMRLLLVLVLLVLLVLLVMRLMLLMALHLHLHLLQEASLTGCSA